QERHRSLPLLVGDERDSEEEHHLRVEHKTRREGLHARDAENQPFQASLQIPPSGRSILRPWAAAFPELRRRRGSGPVARGPSPEGIGRRKRLQELTVEAVGQDHAGGPAPGPGLVQEPVEEGVAQCEVFHPLVRAALRRPRRKRQAKFPANPQSRPERLRHLHLQHAGVDPAEHGAVEGEIRGDESGDLVLARHALTPQKAASSAAPSSSWALSRRTRWYARQASSISRPIASIRARNSPSVPLARAASPTRCSKPWPRLVTMASISPMTLWNMSSFFSRRYRTCASTVSSATRFTMSTGCSCPSR